MPVIMNAQENNNNQAGNNIPGRGAPNPLLNVRDRLFHALFYRIALAYARAFPKSVRRILEFTILVKVCFFCAFLPMSLICKINSDSVVWAISLPVIFCYKTSCNFMPCIFQDKS